MTDQVTATSDPVEDSGAVPGETCARCHTTQAWGSSSWCPNCGFYPSLDAEGISDDSWQSAVPAEPAESGDENLFSTLPGWFWVMMGGMTGILLLGLVVRTQAAEEESLRGIIALSTLGVAFLMIAVAHVIASRYAMKHDPRIRLTDAMVSWFTIWQPTIGQLPASRRRIWSMTWGMTSVITALLIIGGIDYSAPFRTEEQVKTKPFGNKVIQAVTGAASAAGQNGGAAGMEDALGQLTDPSMMAAGQAGAPTSMEDAVSSLASMPGELEGMAATEEEAVDEVETADSSILCIVYGVLTNDEKIPTGFLFAGKPRTQYQHVAEISAEDISKEDYQRLAGRLSRRIQKRPAIPTDYNAVWVDPVLVCKLRYVRMNQDGTVHKPEFEDIVRDGRSRTKPTRAARSAPGRR